MYLNFEITKKDGLFYFINVSFKSNNLIIIMNIIYIFL